MTAVHEAGSATTAAAVVDALLALGIEHLFCNLGTDHAPLIEELARRAQAGEAAPRVTLCAHENTAVHMAAGFAMATGCGQAVLVHVDAGTANAAMGMHNAARFRLPLLLLAGRAPYSSDGRALGGRNAYVNFVQEPFDQGALVRPYVKWEYTLPAGDVAAEALVRAHQRMHAAPQGPVYLMAAREVLAAPTGAARTPARPQPAARYGGPRDEDIGELARRLLAAQRPLLLTAYAGRSREAVAALDALARFAAVRVVEHVPHVLNLPHASPCHAGFQPAAEVPLADVGLMLDIDVPWIPAATQPAPGSWWAHCDTDIEKALFPMWSFAADLRWHGDTAGLLARLLEAMRANADEAFLRRAAARLDRMAGERRERALAAADAAARPAPAGTVSPAYFCARLAEQLEPEDIVLNEAVRHAATVYEQVPRQVFGTRIGPAGGGLGYAGGMALGIKMARPEAAVVSVVGDGSFHFGNPTSVLEASMRYGLPTLTVVLDNGGWSAVREATRRVYPQGHAAGTRAWHAEYGGAMDFAQLARAGGAFGARVGEPDEVNRAVRDGLAAVRGGRPAVLHVRIPSLQDEA